MKKAFVVLLFLLISLGGVTVGTRAVQTFTDQKPVQRAKEILPTKNSIPNQKQTPEIVDVGLPLSLSIPKINVDASVESVGLDAKKAMDVPKDADNGGWYNLGPRPGQKGNSVIAGHYDRANGSPAVFWDLNKLTQGDKIMLKDDKGKERTFSVVRTAKYPYNDFPLQEVFGQSSKPMLNLITCQGAWNTGTRNYSERLVVYAEQAQ